MLDGATSTMLAAMNHIQEVKSRATDAGTELRNNNFFAQRTINSFQGGTEHEMRTMIAALLGMKSHVSSKKFHYMFISDLVCFIDKLIKSSNEKEFCEDTDSSSCSTELSETQAEDILNLDGYDDKIDEMKKLLVRKKLQQWKLTLHQDRR